MNAQVFYTNNRIMNKQQFINLIGEDPEDILGADWENEVEEFLDTRVCFECKEVFTKIGLEEHHMKNIMNSD